VSHWSGSVWSVNMNGVTQTTFLPVLVFYETPGSATAGPRSDRSGRGERAGYGEFVPLTISRACRKKSVACAPETVRMRSNRKNGTPSAPSAAASASSART